MSTLVNDIKHAIRGLRKNPGFTAVATLTLALGIGVNLALFGVLNEMVLRPKPVARPHELWAAVSADAAGQPQFALVYRPFYDAIRREGRHFHDVIAYAPITPKLRTPEGSETIRAELVAGPGTSTPAGSCSVWQGGATWPSPVGSAASRRPR